MWSIAVMAVEAFFVHLQYQFFSPFYPALNIPLLPPPYSITITIDAVNKLPGVYCQDGNKPIKVMARSQL
jgi:hypothetical protein